LSAIEILLMAMEEGREALFEKIRELGRDSPQVEELQAFIRELTEVRLNPRSPTSGDEIRVTVEVPDVTVEPNEDEESGTISSGGSIVSSYSSDPEHLHHKGSVVDLEAKLRRVCSPVDRCLLSLGTRHFNPV
jgi:hypothetical protein